MNLVPYFKNTIAPYLRALLGRSERGAALVEYALLLVLIAVVCLLALEHLGVSTSGGFSQAATSLAE